MIRQLARRLVPGLLMVAGLSAPAGAQEGRSWVFVGTYTGGPSQGIYVLSFNPETGRLGEAELAAETPNPSFLATDPDRRYLFAVNEVGEFEGRPTGSVASFGLDAKTGRLTPINRRPSGGAGPCHLAVDRTGRTVLVANYGGGSVAALPIAPDGMLGSPLSTIQHEGKSIDPARQEGPHAHFITLDAANRHAIVADLGLDKLLIDTFDAENGVLAPFGELKLEGGSGPRHFAFGRDGRHAYVINEMASTIDALDYDPETARFARVQAVRTLPEDFRGASSTAELVVHPSGRFLYGSNRGDDSLAIFAIDPETGRLRAAGRTKTGGKTPRNFAIDPTGRWLIAANQDSNTLVVFRIDPETGGLTQVGEPAAVPVPVCVEFVPVAE